MPPVVTASIAGELQEEIREAFSHSHFGRSVAYRLGRRLLLVRSPDDLVDLAASLDLLLMKPEGEETWAGHGRDRRDREKGGERQCSPRVGYESCLPYTAKHLLVLYATRINLFRKVGLNL